MVQIESEMPLKLKNELSAIPVMIPGRARGRMKRRLIESRPKNAERWIAKAAHDPRISATAVAASPAWTDRSSADRTSGSSHVEVNQLVVSTGIGQLWIFEVLNAYRKMSRIGMNRNRRIRAVHARSAMRVQNPSITVPRMRRGASQPTDRRP